MENTTQTRDIYYHQKQYAKRNRNRLNDYRDDKKASEYFMVAADKGHADAKRVVLDYFFVAED